MRIIGFLLLMGVAVLLLQVSTYILVWLQLFLGWLIRAREYSTRWFVIMGVSNTLLIYLLAGLLARIIWQFHTHDQSIGLFIFYAFIGLCFLYGLMIGSMKSKRENGAYRDEMEARYADYSVQLMIDVIESLCVLPFFILVLLISPLAFNPVIEALFNLCVWVYGIPYVGGLIGIFGIFLCASIVFTGLVGVIGMVASVFIPKPKEAAHE